MLREGCIASASILNGNIKGDPSFGISFLVLVQVRSTFGED